MDPGRGLAAVLELQSGVVNRRQLLGLGLGDHDIRRMRRRRELVALYDGVYLSHTGEPTWLQRAWAAVLLYEPAALCRSSARRAVAGPGWRSDGDPVIHLAVDHGRFLRPPSGVAVHRTVNLAEQVLWNTSPPRQRIEDAALDLAADALSDIDAIAHLADVVGARLTIADRLAEAIARRSRIARRDFLTSVVDDVRRGTCSTLEHGYLTRVERPHGLPAAERQVRDSVKGPVYRDVVYERFGTYVELDGRLGHTRIKDRDRDLERDLDAAVRRAITARLGYGQVFERGCSTAFKIGAILTGRGWSDQPRRCPQCPDSVKLVA